MSLKLFGTRERIIQAPAHKSAEPPSHPSPLWNVPSKEKNQETKPTFGYAYSLFKDAGRDTRHFKRPLASFADTPLDDLSQDMIDREARRHYPNSPPSTIIREFITPVSALVNFAADRGFCARRIIKRPSQKRRRDLPRLHPADANRLIENCSERFRPLFLCLLFTGAHASECVSLKWDQVDLIRREVRFPRTDSLKGRKIPMHPRLFAALTGLPHRDEAVFLRPGRKPYVGKGNGGASIRRAFGTACRSAGISNLCVRDLRHVWALYEFALHRDRDKLMRRGGWRNDRLLDWCKRVSVGDLDELREAYGRWLQHECPTSPEDRRAAKPRHEAVIDMQGAQKSIPRYEVRAPARLVTREEAAHYCRLGLSAFLAVCPVRPISLGNSKRLERYDIHALDEWIDKLGGKGSLSSGSNWLGLVEKPNGSRAREGR